MLARVLFAAVHGIADFPVELEVNSGSASPLAAVTNTPPVGDKSAEGRGDNGSLFELFVKLRARENDDPNHEIL